jgi:hypothetical protein
MITTAHTDANGTVHHRRCWDRAEASLMDELILQGLDTDVEYVDDDATDYRIAEWDTTQQAVVATWLSDGTVTCTCDEIAEVEAWIEANGR